MKISINSRDELVVLDLDKIAYLRADGNYTTIMYIGNREQTLTIGLSKVEQVIRLAIPQNKVSSFVRLGRSLIINSAYLYSINLLGQKIVLSDFNDHFHTLTVSKVLLKQYKDQLSQSLDL